MQTKNSKKDIVKIDFTPPSLSANVFYAPNKDFQVDGRIWSKDVGIDHNGSLSTKNFKGYSSSMLVKIPRHFVFSSQDPKMSAYTYTAYKGSSIRSGQRLVAGQLVKSDYVIFFGKIPSVYIKYTDS